MAELFNDSSPLLLALTETWLRTDTLGCTLRDYSSFRADRSGKVGGGVMLMIHDSLRPVAVPISKIALQHDIYFNMCVADISTGVLNSDRVRICVVYSVPNIPVNVFKCLINCLSDVMVDSCKGKGVPVIICGDLNLPRMDWLNMLSSSDDRLMSMGHFCTQFGLSQLVSCPTRCCSILDVVLSNANVVCDVCVEQPIATCDHCVVKFNVRRRHVSSRLGPVQGFSFYDYSKADWAHFALDLKSVNWSAFFMNCISINDYWLRWLYLVRMLIEKYVPYKTRKSRANQRSKLPARIRNLLSRRNCAWKKFRNGCVAAKQRYKRLRTRCRNAISAYLKDTEWRVLQHRNTKSFYAYVSKRLNTASRQLTSVQRADGSCATQAAEIANIFATEFQRNYAGAKQTIVPPFCKRVSYKCEFNDPVFDFPTVYKALCNVSNSAAGPDNLPGCLFRKLALELTPSLIIIFQKSFFLAVFQICGGWPVLGLFLRKVLKTLHPTIGLSASPAWRVN